MPEDIARCQVKYRYNVVEAVGSSRFESSRLCKPPRDVEISTVCEHYEGEQSTIIGNGFTFVPTMVDCASTELLDIIQSLKRPLQHNQPLPCIRPIEDGFLIAPPHIRHFRIDCKTGNQLIGDVGSRIKSIGIIIGELSV